MRILHAITLGLGGALLAACSLIPGNFRPNDPYGDLSASQVYVEKGVRYMGIGNYEAALKDLERAIDLDSDNSEAYNAIGVLYQHLDDTVKAEANFKKALSVKPDNFGARNNYGRLLCSQGKYAEASEEFKKVMASKLYNQPWLALTNAGVCARDAGKPADAENFLRQALESAPNFPPALLEMAKLSQETGQHMSARAFLQRYFSATKPSPDALLLGTDIELSLGKTQAAKEYAQVLKARFPGTPEAAQARHRFGE
jgi:type IV pilus assembly protein PilF